MDGLMRGGDVLLARNLSSESTATALTRRIDTELGLALRVGEGEGEGGGGGKGTIE